MITKSLICQLCFSNLSLHPTFTENHNHNNNHKDPVIDLENLFQIDDAQLNDNNNISIDLPLCWECAIEVRDILDIKLEKIDVKIKSLFGFQELDTLTFSLGENEQIDLVSLKKEIAELNTEKTQLLDSISQIQLHHSEEKEKLKLLIDSGIQLSELEQEYWSAYGELSTHREDLNREKASFDFKGSHTTELLKTVQDTFILNDTFHLWFHGNFGTINGMKLGRILPSQNVEWTEINAAWGMIAMLMNLLAKELQFKFENYDILAAGSQSKVLHISDNTLYELYGDNLFHIFWAHRYDRAMQGVLDCLDQLIQRIRKKDTRFFFPYEIDKDKIAGLNIKLQFNPEDKWTKALKFMITDLKFIVAWLARNQTT